MQQKLIAAEKDEGFYSQSKDLKTRDLEVAPAPPPPAHVTDTATTTVPARNVDLGKFLTRDGKVRFEARCKSVRVCVSARVGGGTIGRTGRREMEAEEGKKVMAQR